MNVPAKLELSGPIDRDGAGETPAVGSTYRLVPSIPRGPAVCWQWAFTGGRPRCPVCLKSSRRIRWNRRRGKLPPGDFHCRKCLVTWLDTKDVTCFICEHVYTHTERGIGMGKCYHANTIKRPFCGTCEAIIGADVNHGRRQLRRMVGLRAPLTVVQGGKG